MIICRVCSRKPSDEPGNVHLVRMNEKGVIGIWECAPNTGCKEIVIKDYRGTK